MKNKFTPTGILEINNTASYHYRKIFFSKKIEGYMLVQDKKTHKAPIFHFKDVRKPQIY